MQDIHAEHLEKRKLNQLALISRLYPEILSTIFCYVRDSTICPTSTVAEGLRTIDCIDFTHVCHEWRDIAINNPMLWTEIFISVKDHVEWVQEMLRRSKQCPLSILVSKPPGWNALSTSKALDPILHGLKNNMHRFRELRLQYVPIDVLHNFFSNSITNRLEYLCITPYYYNSDDDDTSSSEAFPSDNPSVSTFTLSDQILRVDSLRHLSIERCGLDFHTAFLRSLTCLELRDIEEDCRLPCTEFVAVLTTIPELERLTLTGFLPEDGVEDVEGYVATTNKTHLNIKHLDLGCHVLSEMIQFLCILILPSSCKIFLRMWDGSSEIPPGLPLINSWLSRHFQPVPFHSFRIHFRSWNLKDTSYVTSDLRVTGFYNSELEGDEVLLSASLMCLNTDSEGRSIDNVWRSFLKSLPLSNLVSLEVMDSSKSFPPPDSIWAEIFAPLPTLQTIIIDSIHYAAFFRIASAGLSNLIALPFPALSSVTVKARPQGGVQDYLCIATSMDSRLGAGLAPFNLVLYTENIEPHAIAQLRKSALNVDIRVERLEM